MKKIDEKIQEIVIKLFDDNKIDLFIGYEGGTLPLQSRPFFIRREAGQNRAAAVGKLVWNSFCSNNLAVYLPKYFENNPFKRKNEQTPKLKVGIAAKGCDLRSIFTLIKEKQALRENLVLIGVPCMGMVDKRKVLSLVHGDEIDTWVENQDGTLQMTTAFGKSITVAREEALQEACRECRFPAPENTDFIIEGKSREAGNGGYQVIDEFEKQDVKVRWEYFKKEISKCIRCNACRQACPTCYCKECFAEQTDLRWIGVSTELTDTMIFHLIRIFHQAGRCVECDACYRACPMNIDLRTFTKKIVKDVDEFFKYRPNFSMEETPPLSTFKEGDCESFITEP
ncbi:MAG: Coenzyme F420 hydrogenase/dehydrogenase, beta subunit C-terminal domain [Spirochaetota bacterium]